MQSKSGGQTPSPGLPSPTALLGGVDYLIPAGRWERAPAACLPPVSRRRWSTAAPQYEVVLAAPGRGVAVAAAAPGGPLREPPGAARPGLEAFLFKPRGRGCDTKVRGSRVPAGLSALHVVTWGVRGSREASQVGQAGGTRLI